MGSLLRAEMRNARELLEADTEPFDGVQQAEGVEFRSTAGNNAGAKRPLKDRTGKGGRSRCGTRSNQFSHASNQRDSLSRRTTAADLDPNRTDAALTVRRAEHRESGGQAVTPVRRDACTDPTDVGKILVEEYRCWQLGPITIVGANWLGEPTQFAAGASRLDDRFAVMQSICMPRERSVMLARARGTRRAVDSNMNLVACLKLPNEVAR